VGALSAQTVIDWPALLGDIAYLLGEPTIDGTQRTPVAFLRLAEYLRVPRTTAYGWLAGQQPKHADGERLIERWCALTGKARTFVPVTRPVLSAHSIRR
jgi:hypothetical protein